MKALIIAAGRGKRFEQFTRHQPKPLIKLLGLTLIERVILTAKQAGINEFIVVIGYRGEQLRTALSPKKLGGVKIRYVENNDWKRGNGISLLKAKPYLKERFMLLMSDHIVDTRILENLVNVSPRATVMLAVDRRNGHPDDTKVLEKDGKIIKIGKHLKVANCIDTGVFLCDPKIFEYAEKSINSGKTELADCIRTAAENGDAEIFDITKINCYIPSLRKHATPWWVDVDTPEELKIAERYIVEHSSKGASDFLAYYVHKPIENRLVILVAKSRLTPNQITLLVNALAYTVTCLYFLGHLLPGVLLAFVVGVVDGIDGKLARVKFESSKLGTLEHPFDLLFEFSWFFAISWFLHRMSGGESLPLVLCCFILIFVAFYRFVYDQFRKTMGYSLDDSGDFERKFRRIAGRRNLYNIPLLVGILLTIYFNDYNFSLYTLIFILAYALLTAVVYSWRAIVHMRASDVCINR